MSAFFKRLSQHVAQNVVVQGLNILTSVAIIAFLPLEEIAELAVVMLVAAPVAMLGTLRLQWILLNTSSAMAARLVYRAGVQSSAIAGPIALALMLAFHNLGWFNFDLPSLSVLFLGALYCVAISVNTVTLPFHLVQSSIRENMKVRLLHSAIRFALSALLCFTLKSVEAVFVSEVCAALGVLLITQTFHVLRRRNYGVTLSWLWIWRNHKRMLVVSTPSALLNSLASNLVPVVVISIVGEAAGGITYSVQRLAGIPVKLAVTTFGEAWHKMVRRGDPRAVLLATNPLRIFTLILAILLATLLIINVLVLSVEYFGIAALLNDKWASLFSAVYAYQLFFAATLSVNLFNRVLIMRSAIHRKILFDIALLVAPITLMVFPNYLDRSITVNDALFVLSIVQSLAYAVLAGLIISESLRWSLETRAAPNQK